MPVSIAFPDLPRAARRAVVLEGESLDDAPAVLRVSADGDAPVTVVLDARRPARIDVPAGGRRGLRLDLAAERGAPPARLRVVRVGGAWPSPLLLVFAAAVAALVAAGAGRVETVTVRGSLALGAFAAACATVVHSALTGAVAVGWSPPAVAVPALLILAAGVLAFRVPDRAPFSRAALLVAAAAFGLWARVLSAPSAGSWDMDYWRAWTERALSHGVTGAYGPPDGGGGALWQVEHAGRRFVIDYPPLAIAAWRSAAALVQPRGDAAWNVALKLPALAGDALAVALLLWLWPRGRPGARAAAAYWAFPSSWLSSATLGYLDGAYVPFVFASAIAAGASRAAPAGAWLALAALVKPTALVCAPAIAVALRAPRRLLIAAAAGLAVVAAAMTPFLIAGTAGTAVAHVRAILHQERLSGGYANPWWALGAFEWGQFAPVPYVRVAATPFPARPASLIAFAATAIVVGRALARGRGIAPTVAACGALFAAYGVLGIGVHVNHPHAVALLFVAAGTAALAPRWPAALLVHGYALNILLVEQLGRLAGPRYGPLVHVNGWLDALRVAPGFDLTLPLAGVHTLALALLVVRALRRPVDSLQVADAQSASKLDPLVKYGLE